MWISRMRETSATFRSWRRRVHPLIAGLHGEENVRRSSNQRREFGARRVRLSSNGHERAFEMKFVGSAKPTPPDGRLSSRASNGSVRVARRCARGSRRFRTSAESSSHNRTVVPRQYSDGRAESPRKQTRRGPNELFGLPTTLTTRLHTKEDSELPLASSRRVNGLTLLSIAEVLQARTKEILPGSREANCNRRCRGGPGRCSAARLYGEGCVYGNRALLRRGYPSALFASGAGGGFANRRVEEIPAN